MTTPEQQQGDRTSCDPRVFLDEGQDDYGYSHAAEALAETIRTAPTPYVIGLYSRWGRGKSSFLESLQKILEGEEFTALTFSPWQYQLNTFQDAWMALVTELAEGNVKINEFLKGTVEEINDFRSKAGRFLGKGARVLWEAAKAGGAVGDALAAGAEEAMRKDVLEEKAPPKNDYQFFMTMKKQLAERLAAYRQENNGVKLLVLVDDLDRCEPKVSVHVLRAIQLLCREKGIVFVLAVDREVVVNNLSGKYDPQYAREYLDKMVQLHIELPEIPADLVIRKLVRGRAELDELAEWIAQVLHYNPRKVERFCHLYDHLKRFEPEAKPAARVWQSALSVRWPSVATLGRRAGESNVLTAISDFCWRATIPADVIKSYEYMGNIKEIAEDRELLSAFQSFVKRFPSALTFDKPTTIGFEASTNDKEGRQ